MNKFIPRLLFCIIKFILQIPLILLGGLLLFFYLPIHFDLIDRGLKTTFKLPCFLRWFDCADLYSKFNRTPITYLTKVIPNGWFYTYIWLAWRNPINYFNYNYLTFIWQEPKLLAFEGSPNVGDSTGDIAGLKYIEVQIKDKIYYEYYYIFKYSMNTCFRFRMGYKIGDMLSNKPGEYVQDVFVISPYHSYSGK